MSLPFDELPDFLQVEIADEWGVLPWEAGCWFDNLRAAARWEIVFAFVQTSPTVALTQHLATTDATHLRDAAHLMLARSRALEAAV